jgi:hypothetical protein
MTFVDVNIFVDVLSGRDGFENSIKIIGNEVKMILIYEGRALLPKDFIENGNGDKI